MYLTLGIKWMEQDWLFRWIVLICSMVLQWACTSQHWFVSGFV